MAALKEHARVQLTHPLPAGSLGAGAEGVIVHVHVDGMAFEVEFLAADGSTITVETVPAAWLRAL